MQTKQSLINDLQEIIDEKDSWKEEEEIEINVKSVEYAKQLVNTLPDSIIRSVHIGMNPDGTVHLIWREDDMGVIYLVFNSTPHASWYFYSTGKKESARGSFDVNKDEMPNELIELIDLTN